MTSMMNKKILKDTTDYTGNTPTASDLQDKTTESQTIEQLNYQIIDLHSYTEYKTPILERPTEKDDVDEEIIREISNINYKHVLTPAL